MGRREGMGWDGKELGNELKESETLIVILQGFQTLDMRCENTNSDGGVAHIEINRLERVDENHVMCNCSVIALSGERHATLRLRGDDQMMTCALIIQRCPIVIPHSSHMRT
jgi:hypothetical protein